MWLESISPTCYLTFDFAYNQAFQSFFLKYGKIYRFLFMASDAVP
jgi:hypothetical protein